LFGNIFHQGTRYQAAPRAVPFLYELINAEDTPARHQIVYLLVSLALGYEETYLPDGFDPAAFRRQLEKYDARMSRAERAECAEYGCGPRVDLACYNAVRKGVPSLIRLLDDADVRLRRAAVYALAWFPASARRSSPRIRRLLETESDDASIANAALAIGLLIRRSTYHTNLDSVRILLSYDSRRVRVAAAIALAHDPLEDELVDILIQDILSPDVLKGFGEAVWFNEGNLAGYAALVLGRWGTSSRARIVPALCETLRAADPDQALDITRALLQLIVAGKRKSTKEIPRASLGSLELTALRAIAEHGAWEIDGATFVNYCELVGAYGLPASRKALIKYLGRK
jgi:hypothetical protein